MPPPPSLLLKKDPESPEETIIHLTGFGLFGQHEINPSFELLKDLPSSFALPLPERPNHRVVLKPHPEPVRVAYKDVQSFIRTFWSPDSTSTTADSGAGLSARISELRVSGPSGSLTTSTAASIASAEEEAKEAAEAWGEEASAAIGIDPPSPLSPPLSRPPLLSRLPPAPSAPETVLHIGVGRPESYYLETRAHESGYWRRDVDGEVPPEPTGVKLEDKEYEEESKKSKEQRRGATGRELMVRGVDVKGIVSSVGGTVEAGEDEVQRIRDAKAKTREQVKGGEKGKEIGDERTVPGNHEEQDEDEDERKVKIKVSNDAGLFLCDFILRSSLLEIERLDALEREADTGPVDRDGDAGLDGANGSREKRKKRRRAAFLHVPQVGQPYGLETGRKVVLKVLEGIAKGVVEGLEGVDA